MVWLLLTGPFAAQDPAPSAPIPGVLSHTLEVKHCFVPLFRAGTYPQRVELRFEVSSEGALTAFTVAPEELQGSDLEACLRDAVTATPFPPDPPPRSFVYPLLLEPAPPVPVLIDEPPADPPADRRKRRSPRSTDRPR